MTLIDFIGENALSLFTFELQLLIILEYLELLEEFILSYLEMIIFVHVFSPDIDMWIVICLMTQRLFLAGLFYVSCLSSHL
jgi:hypothetical protein